MAWQHFESINQSVNCPTASLTACLFGPSNNLCESPCNRIRQTWKSASWSSGGVSSARRCLATEREGEHAEGCRSRQVENLCNCSLFSSFWLFLLLWFFPFAQNLTENLVADLANSFVDVSQVDIERGKGLDFVNDLKSNEMSASDFDGVNPSSVQSFLGDIGWFWSHLCCFGQLKS